MKMKYLTNKVDNVFKMCIENKVICIILYLSFFKPLSLYYFYSLNKIYNVIMAISGIFIICMYLCFIKKEKKISNIQLFVIIFGFFILLSTTL